MDKYIMKNIFAALALCVAATTSSAATLTFTETEFRETDFTFERFIGDENSQAATPVNTGNPGGALEIGLTGPNPDQVSTYITLVEGAQLDLSSFTPDFFNFSLDFNVQPGASSRGHQFGLVVRQDGVNFGFVNNTGSTPGQRTLRQSQLTQDDLFALSVAFGARSGELDLSPQGGTLQFGFFTSRLDGRQDTVIYDNFTLDVVGVSPVPVPAAISFVLSGLAAMTGLGYFGRRRKHV